MSVIIFGDSFTFPEGSAATNRVHAFAKGFAENDINVHVICFANDYTDDLDGITENIRYYHPFGQSIRNNHFFMRRWLKFVKYIKAYHLLRKINNEEKIIAINVWTEYLLTQFYLFIVAKILKTKIIIERSEHPLRKYKNNKLSEIYGNIKLTLEIKLNDGIFCISRYLMDFYMNRGFPQRKLFLVPSTVDTERFSKQFKSPLSFEYILYCGSLTILKDGVNILIESFASIAQKYPGLNLVLIGSTDSAKNEIFINDLVTTLNIGNRIIFLGQLSRTDVPAYLCHAKVLALARPDSIISDAGFPSKLTEYLATGNPVVVTKVGEISGYLQDDENVFLSEPDSAAAFADKLDYVLANYDFARQVGKRGKELTETIFNYSFQAKRMIGFIHSL